MKNLKVCFVGIGSIAKRHIHNLGKICREKNIGLIIDAVRTKNVPLESDIQNLIRKTYIGFDDIDDNYDITFITNPTEYHLMTLKEMMNKSQHFFIEKPLSSIDQLSQIENLELKANSIYYVACPLRYTHVIQYIKEFIKSNKVLSVRCVSSSYLPNWRSNIDYRKTYSAHKKMGGGVTIDLIHEWDYLQYLFGFPKKINYFSGKKSNLEIDSDDYAIYIAEYNDKIIELHLDYFGKNPIREIMLITENETIIGDLLKSEIRFLNSDEVIDFGEKRNDFQLKELKNFLNMIEKKNKNINTLVEAKNTLFLTQGKLI